MFAPFPDKPDHDALEREILALWEREATFAKLRAKNADGPRFSFFDGPVTANKSLAVHTAWGRTLKDVFQRYKALRGYHQRYQNGFDCQGLWIEVGVERELGLNSKREIEEFGLAEFARRCREVVVKSSRELTEGLDPARPVDGLGQRLLHVLRHEHRVHLALPPASSTRRGWLVDGPPLDRVVPALRHVDLGPRAPRALRGSRRPVALRALPAARPRRASGSSSGRRRPGRCPRTSPPPSTRTPTTGCSRTASGSPVALFPDETFTQRRAGSRARRAALRGAVRHARARLAGRAPRDPVGRRRARHGHRHRPHRAGLRRRGLRAVEGARPRRARRPVDESGRFYPEYGWLHGLSTGEAAEQIVGDLGDRGLLVRAETAEHSYPFCWRCHTPLIFRLSDDWFIAVDELRQPLLDANATVEWTPAYMGKRMDDWLRNMGDWNISRRRYYGLPLPFYPCECGHLNVIGSRAELEERALGGLDQLEELRRPWIDAVQIACAECGEPVTRVEEVGDVWLDAGIVPFSTLGWQNPEYVPEGYATGAAKGLTTADLPDHATWEQWFPADWVSEMREQIRLWFYSQLFMSVALTGRAPFRKVLGYEKMLDEHGREMHGSWGNMIDAEDAFARMGADVMRWQYCAQPPDRNLLFGFGPAQEIKRRLLTLWNSAKFLADYGAIESFRPTLRRPRRRRSRCRAAAARPLARRADGPARRGGAGRLRALAHGRRDARLRRVRRRSLELVHPPLAAPLLGRRRDGAAHALVRARAGAPRDRAGDAVPRRAPLAGARRRCRRGRAGLGLPRRAGPSARAPDAALLAEVAELRTRRRARPPGAVGRRG